MPDAIASSKSCQHCGKVVSVSVAVIFVTPFGLVDYSCTPEFSK
jgi:hypothetical protein